MLDSLRDWLASRTADRTRVEAILDEPRPRGAGRPLGSIVTVLLTVQVATGLVLGMYYVPSPPLAFDSIRFITTDLPLGGFVRGVHYWGASFIVASALVHLLRVFVAGSYRAPREVTLITGVVLLLLLVASVLAGYVLPWDQKPSWATTATINAAWSSPFLGTV